MGYMIESIVYLVVVFVVILLSMTLHEAMHAFASYWLGDDTAKHQGRLTLNPLKHIDPIMTIVLPITLAVLGLPVFGGAKPVPFRPDRVKGGDWGAAAVALAGPFTNFVIAFVVYGIWVVSGAPSTDGTLGMVLQTAVVVNLGFFIFNMFPIPPLDGSRFIFAIAPEFVRRMMVAIERYGIIVVFALVLLFSSQISYLIQTFMELILGLFDQIYRI